MSQRVQKRAPALVVCVSLAMATLAACGRSPREDTAGRTSTSPTAATASPTRPGDSPTTSATDAAQMIEVAFAGGQISAGRRTERVNLGERVRIRAVSDVPEELHVHTYDLRQPLEPSQPAEIAFIATIPGRHEVEFEKSGKHALTLEVS